MQEHSDSEKVSASTWANSKDNFGPESRVRASDVEGIFIADCHFSHTPPIAHSVEKNWYKAQDRYLEQLWQLQEEHNAPIFCAGDIFHKALSQNELVNFLLRRLPSMYAIPGNHDLLHHSYDDIRKTAFWTLVEAGKVKLIEPDKPIEVGFLSVHGFPYGFEIKPPASKHPDWMVRVALVHAYCWTDGKGFPGASNKHHVDKYAKKLKGYDLAVFGDNHIAHKTKFDSGLTIINAGGMMPRNADEQKRKPCAWLLRKEKKVERHNFDTSKDKWLEQEPNSMIETNKGIDDFVSELEDTKGVRFDFADAVKRYITKHEVKGKLKRTLLEAIENG